MAVSAIHEQRDSRRCPGQFHVSTLNTDRCISIVIVNTIKGITRGDVSFLSPNYSLHVESDPVEGAGFG